MQTITDIRLSAQQLASPDFDRPEDLVDWMGALQAQDYAMSKWAVGIRLKSASVQAVEDALARGEIVRTHVLRPTWHLVSARDVRWMLGLTSPRIVQAVNSYSKGRGLDEKHFSASRDALEKILEGHRHLTREEIGMEFAKKGLPGEKPQMTCLMMRAEVEGIVCCGLDKGVQRTYALLEERIPPAPSLCKDEALAALATKYFRSHSPATLEDFVWWSGLPVSEARQAVGLIRPDLIEEKGGYGTMLVHRSCSVKPGCDKVIHLLPAYDEYLISYKDRTAVLAAEHYPKAFTNFGVFFPVILHKGHIVGNWSRLTKGRTFLETSFFRPSMRVAKKRMDAAESRYRDFIGVK